MDTLTKITAEEAAKKLLLYGWYWQEGFWRPGIAVVSEKPEITPGNYTAVEAVKFYGYMVEED